MVVKIYGYNIPVFTTLKELDIPYEYVPVNMKENEHKSKEWIENMHPFGQVPVMIVSSALYSFTCICTRKYGIDTGTEYTCGLGRMMASSSSRLALFPVISSANTARRATSSLLWMIWRSTDCSSKPCLSRHSIGIPVHSESCSR